MNNPITDTQIYAVELAQYRNGEFSAWLPPAEFIGKQAAWAFVKGVFGKHAWIYKDIRWMAYKV